VDDFDATSAFLRSKVDEVDEVDEVDAASGKSRPPVPARAHATSAYEGAMSDMPTV
jgi:hypothetical protein